MSTGVWKCRGFGTKKAALKRLHDYVAVTCPGKTADVLERLILDHLPEVEIKKTKGGK